MSGKIRCAVVGVGNCFAGLVQGIEYYRLHPEQEVVGVMSPTMGGYSIHDIDFVAAFDVDSKKVGKPLNEAVYAEPNKVRWIGLDPRHGGCDSEAVASASMASGHMCRRSLVRSRRDLPRNSGMRS